MSKLLLLLAEGFEEVEALTTADLLRRAGLDCDLCALGASLHVCGSHRILVTADLLFQQVDPEDYDGIILPGGMPGTRHLAAEEGVRRLLRKYCSEGKLTAAICAAPTVLAEAGLLNGKKAVCYPGMEEQLSGAEVLTSQSVTDGSIITGRGLGAAIPFALEIVRYYMGAETALKLAQQIVYA